MNKSGFTLLFASLVGSLVIAVGMAILNITLKQLILASAGRESQQAFFAADAGVECALYLDRGAGLSASGCQLGLFGAPSTTASGMSICGQDLDIGSYNNTDSMQCFGKQISVTRTLATGGQSVTNTFSLRANNPSGSGGGENADMCFEVAVKKTLDNLNEATTIIESRGYNKCSSNTANRFERAIRSVNK